MRHPLFHALIPALALTTAACASQIPHGTGPVALRPNVQLAFQRHLDHPRPLVFLIAVDGSTAYGMHCPHVECEPDPLYILAQRRCEDRATQPCRVFAEYGRITWQGPVGHVSPGEGAVAGAVVEWGSNGVLHNFKIGGLGPGAGTVSGKIRDAACTGAIDARALTWRLECGANARARGTLATAGHGRWNGLGWSEDRVAVRLFVAADIALGRGTAPSGEPIVRPPTGGTVFLDLPPTYEEPAPPMIRGGSDRVGLRWRR